MYLFSADSSSRNKENWKQQNIHKCQWVTQSRQQNIIHFVHKVWESQVTIWQIFFHLKYYTSDWSTMAIKKHLYFYYRLISLSCGSSKITEQNTWWFQLKFYLRIRIKNKQILKFKLVLSWNISIGNKVQYFKVTRPNLEHLSFAPDWLDREFYFSKLVNIIMI